MLLIHADQHVVSMSRCSLLLLWHWNMYEQQWRQKVAHGKAGERGVSYAVVREGGGKRLLRVAVRDVERRLVGLIAALRLVERLSTTISLPS